MTLQRFIHPVSCTNSRELWVTCKVRSEVCVLLCCNAGDAENWTKDHPIPELEELGMTEVPIVGDGNCWARGASVLVFGHDACHAAVRTEVCNYEEANWLPEYESEGEPGKRQ